MLLSIVLRACSSAWEGREEGEEEEGDITEEGEDAEKQQVRISQLLVFRNDLIPEMKLSS